MGEPLITALCEFYLSIVLSPQPAHEAVRPRAFAALLCHGAFLYSLKIYKEIVDYENPVSLPQCSQHLYAGVLS